MLKSYMFSIGVIDGESGNLVGEDDFDNATTMRVYSRVVVHDDDGTANDDWVNDSFLEGIGDRSGTWTYMPSQRALLLWGQALEFQARIKGVSWPPKEGSRGSIELRKPMYGSRVLSYRVSVL